MKRALTSALLILLMLFALSCGQEEEAEEESTPEERTERYYDIIRSAGIEGIEIETKNVNMWNDTEGSARILAKVPNYTEMFLESFGEEDMTKALSRLIRKKEYTTVDYEGSASVSVVAGEQVIDADSFLKESIEKELIKAINAIMDLEAEE